MAAATATAGAAAGGSTRDFPLLLTSVFGANFKIVSGYPGGNAINLAVERGEVDQDRLTPRVRTVVADLFRHEALMRLGPVPGGVVITRLSRW